MTALGDAVRDRSVLIVGGSGGVGKTTTSAALAVAAANRTGRRVLVLTVDPARRLADVLGVDLHHHEPVKVQTDGELHAVMLDAKASWDALVRRHAPDARTASAILANPLYGDITERFVQSHDYIAMELLYELHESGQYDLIIVDTPPSAHAVDFLDAPDRMAAFFDSKLLKFLIAPARASFMNLTSRAFLQLANRLLGKRFLGDITELFSMLETMRPGFIDRANKVRAILRDEATAFVAVTTPEPSPTRSAQRLIEEVKTRGMRMDAVVVNRALPPYLSAPASPLSTSDLGPYSPDFGLEQGPGSASEARVLERLHANFGRMAALAQAQREALGHGEFTVAVELPWISGEISDVAALDRLGGRLLDTR